MGSDKYVEIGEERREPSNPSRLSLQQIKDIVDAQVKRRLAEHAAEEAQRMDKRFDELKALLTSAFPGGDPDEHRRYHDEVIEFMRERRRLWASIREKSITALIWALLVGTGTALWQGIKTKLGLP